jgi:hypothetical protein
MPLDFNTTFVLPLTADIDQGRLASSRDLANAITDYYINTIKMGLPQNVPPTLPAPSLSGTPFPIGPAGYINADASRLKFYNVVHKYLSAKDQATKKRKLQNLLSEAIVLKNRIKAKQSEVKSLIDQAKALSIEIKALPTLISELSKSMKAVSLSQLDAVVQLEAMLREAREGGVEGGVNILFADELDLIRRIKSFNFQNIQAAIETISGAGVILSKLERTLIRTGGVGPALKEYALNKLKTVVSFFKGLIEIIKNPVGTFNFAKRLLFKIPAAGPIFLLLDRIGIIEKVFKPQLKRLEKKIQDRRLEIENKLKSRLERVSQARRAQKQKPVSKRVDKFARAASIKQERAKRSRERVEQIRRKITLVRDIVQSAAIIVGRVDQLKKEFATEFDVMSKTLAKISVNRARSPRFAATNVRVLQLQTSVTAQALDNASLIQPLTQQNLAGITQNLTQLTAAQQQRQTIFEYLKEHNIQEYVVALDQAVSSAGVDFFAFKEIFERTDLRYKRYLNSIADIEAASFRLSAKLIELSTGKPTDFEPIVSPYIRNKSFRDVLKFFQQKINNRGKRLEEKAKRKEQQLQLQLQQQAQNTAANNTAQASQLTPKSTKIESRKRKIQELRAKAEEARSKSIFIKRYVSYVGVLSRVVKSSVALRNNLRDGDYVANENFTYINDIVDGVYAVLLGEATEATRPAIIEQRNELKEQLFQIKQISVLVELFLDIRKSINSGEFQRDWAQFLQTIKTLSPSDFVALSAINDVFNAKNAKEAVVAILALNEATLVVLNSSTVVSKLLELERKYIAKVQAVASQIARVFKKNSSVARKATKIANSDSSVIAYLLGLTNQKAKSIRDRIQSKIEKIISKLQARILKKIDRRKDQGKSRIQTLNKKYSNGLETRAFGRVLGAASKAFWAGATWLGPTGSQHIMTSIGRFKRIRAKPVDGTAVFLEDIGKSFANQLTNAKGTIIPPPATGITPITFTGYK